MVILLYRQATEYLKYRKVQYIIMTHFYGLHISVCFTILTIFSLTSLCRFHIFRPFKTRNPKFEVVQTERRYVSFCIEAIYICRLALSRKHTSQARNTTLKCDPAVDEVYYFE